MEPEKSRNSGVSPCLSEVGPDVGPGASATDTGTGPGASATGAVPGVSTTGDDSGTVETPSRADKLPSRAVRIETQGPRVVQSELPNTQSSPRVEQIVADTPGDAEFVGGEQTITELPNRPSDIVPELPVAFVTFKTRLGAALVSHSQQHADPLLWITDMAPEPRDVSWRNLVIPYRLLPLCRLGVIVAATLLTIFFAIPVTAVQGIAKFEKLKKWFPPAKALQLIPGLSSIITGYLPSAVLKGFIYIVPFAMLGMAKLAGCISKSKEEIKASNMVFYFLVGNVFFWNLLSGSLLDEIGESFTHPKDIPSHLATAVSAQADFFVTYILTDGLSGFSLEILQPGLLCWDAMKSCTYGRGKEKTPFLYSLPYYRIIPTVSLSVLIGMIEDVYETVYDTCGQYWPYIHHYILIANVLMQITMIGLFGLKSKPAASISTVPLLFLTLMFNEYCKIRFLPTFHLLSIQNAKEFDELDVKCNQMEFNYESASIAYCPPCLRPLNVMKSEPSYSPSIVSTSSI
ncbi:hypothetical protein ACLB2K_068417 [Fragaria x ananassa]